jgi:hypothetical protein
MTAHALDRLSAYLDGELTVVDAAAVRQHLSECEACAARLRELQAVDRALADMPVAAPPGYFDAFASRVRSRIEAAPPHRRALGLPVWSWAVAAALLLAVLLPRLPWEDMRPQSAKVPVPAPPGTPAAERATPPTPLAADEKLARSQPRPRTTARKDAAAPGTAASPAAEGSWAAPPPADPGAPPKLRQAEADTSAAPASLESRDATLAEAHERPRDQAPAHRSASGLQKEERPSAAPPLAPEGGAAVREAKRGRAQLGAVAAPADAVEAEFAALGARPAESEGERRGLREAFRSFARRHPGSPRADEARVRAVSLGIEIARSSGEARDVEEARREARDYLARGDATQKDRVKALLAGLEP